MIDPRESNLAALQVAALPDEFTPRERKRLFERGFEMRTTEGEFDRDCQIQAVETTGLCAWKEKVRRGEAKTPLVDDSGLLAADTALAAVCIMSHSVFDDTSPKNIQGLEHLCELYAHSLQQLIARRDDYRIEQDIAEVIYGKDPDGDTPHPGRVCTGVGQFDNLPSDQFYVELPMAAASEDALVRSNGDGWGGDYKEYDEASNEQILTLVNDNHLYVPAGHLPHQHYHYLRDTGFGALVASMREMLTDEQRHWITNNATAIKDRIDRFERGGQYEYLYSNWDRDRHIANLLRNAVFAEPSIDDTGPVTAAQVYMALDSYTPGRKFEKRQMKRFHTESATERTLEDLAEKGYIRSDSGSSNESNVYWLGTNSESLNVGHISDLFKLPCMANMAERLHEEGPVRKDLFSFARMVMWLPQYRNSNIDVIVEDIKEVFEQFPWFDEQETDYQVRYEYHQGEIDGEPPLPRNCHNDDLQRYCIGTEKCPYYTIYQTVPFPQKMYDHLDETDSTFSF